MLKVWVGCIDAHIYRRQIFTVQFNLPSLVCPNWQAHTGADMYLWTLTLRKWQMSCDKALTNCGSRSVTPSWALITWLSLLSHICLSSPSASQETKWMASCTLQRDVGVCVWFTKPSDSRGQRQMPGWDACRFMSLCDMTALNSFKSDKVENYTSRKHRGCMLLNWELALFSSETQP